jgi:hypothetical protein
MYCNPSADGEYITIGWEDYGKKGCDYEVKLTMSDLLYLVARLGTRGNKVAKAVYSGLGLGNVV